MSLFDPMSPQLDALRRDAWLRDQLRQRFGPSADPDRLGDLLPKTMRLSDGTVGYFVRGFRTDDCMAAAIATCLQVPIEQVPDPQIDRRLAAGESPDEIDRSARLELARWLTKRGLRMVAYSTVPTSKPARWVGVVSMPGAFNSHCLVLSRDKVLFDPVKRESQLRPVRAFSYPEVDSGFSFVQLSKENTP